VRRRIDVREFLEPGPLWWAFNWASAHEQARRAHASIPSTPDGWKPDDGVVVLVDEIDKADSAVPNGLLDALGHGRFEVPGGAISVNREHPPLVVITTNEERSLPDAFLRRCLVLHLGLPVDPEALKQALVARGRAHYPKCSAEVLMRAAELLAVDRNDLRKQGLMPPGVAEYIDLVQAVIKQCKTKVERLALLDRIAKFALRKHPPELGL
jgi:MoxR-like ATPase